MAFTVLKKSKADERQIEVAGEFTDQAEANKFVEESQLDDTDNEYEYSVEFPPSLIC